MCKGVNRNSDAWISQIFGRKNLPFIFYFEVSHSEEILLDLNFENGVKILNFHLFGEKVVFFFYFKMMCYSFLSLVQFWGENGEKKNISSETSHYIIHHLIVSYKHSLSKPGHYLCCKWLTDLNNFACHNKLGC